METIELRPYEADDDLRLNEILGDPPDAGAHAARALLRPASDRPLSRCVVAELGGVPIGACGISASELHPGRAFAHVEVARTERGRGLATRLLAAARDELIGTPLEGLGLRTTAAPGSEAEAFARHLGAVELHRSRMVRIPGGVLPRPELEGRSDGAELKVTSAGSARLAVAFADWYTRLYADTDPTPELSPGQVHRMFLSEAAGAHGAALVLREGEVDAFAVSYASGGTDDEESTPLTVGGSERLGGADLDLLLGVLAAEHPVILELASGQPAVERWVEDRRAAGLAQIVAEQLTLGT